MTSHIKLQDGTTWPNPASEAFLNVAWRLRYAKDQLSVTDGYIAAEVLEAYQSLISHPARTLKETYKIISELRRLSAVGRKEG